jgi:TatD DNase family protein
MSSPRLAASRLLGRILLVATAAALPCVESSLRVSCMSFAHSSGRVRRFVLARRVCALRRHQRGVSARLAAVSASQSASSLYNKASISRSATRNLRFMSSTAQGMLASGQYGAAGECENKDADSGTRRSMSKSSEQSALPSQSATAYADAVTDNDAAEAADISASRSIALFDVDCNLMHSQLHQFVKDVSPYIDSSTITTSSINGDIGGGLASAAATTETTTTQGDVSTDCGAGDAVTASTGYAEHPVWKLLQYDVLDEASIESSTTAVSTPETIADAVTATAACRIAAMLSPSSTLKEARDGLALLRQLPGSMSVTVKTTVGVHPYHVQDADLPSLQEGMQEMRDMIEQDAMMQHVVAVGECGLDSTDGFPPLSVQLPWFERQVELAAELGMPLFVHERGAFAETLGVLSRYNDASSVLIHCFTGSRSDCEAYVARGYSISLSGYIYRSEAAEVVTALRDGIIPLDRLMIETDAPYLGYAGGKALFWQRHGVVSMPGKMRKRFVQSHSPNLPSSLFGVLDRILELINEGRSQRGEELLTREALALSTTENAMRMFRLKSI